MAKDKKPNAWIPSIAESGGTVSFPLASITGLTGASGDLSTSTGDVRSFLNKLFETLYAHQEGLAPADKLATQQISKIVSQNNAAVTWQLRITGATGTFTPGTEP